MTSIEDQTNQLFSSIIINSRSYKNAQYNGETFILGTGPLRTSADGSKLLAVLDENEGILGLGHPITAKALLLAALDGGGRADQENITELTNSLSTFFSKFYPDLSCSLGTIQGETVQDLGRSVNFFTKETLDLLRSGKAICSLNFLSVPVTIFPKNLNIKSTNHSISTSDFRQTKDFLKLLELGQVYGDLGSIYKKQKLLIEFFKKIDSDALVDGLIVKLSIALDNEQVITSTDHILYFPFLFDEETLVTIGGFLGK